MKMSMSLAALAAIAVSVVYVFAVDGQENNVQRNKLDGNSNPPVAKMPIVGSWEWWNEFWYSNRFGIAESLHDARIHYRKGQMEAARDEIKQAILGIKLISKTAETSQQAGLQTAIANLGDIERQIANGEKLKVENLRTAIARANLVISKHHFSKANKATQKNDMLEASRRLVAAADHLRNAANAASLAPSPIVGTIMDDYGTFGSVDLNIGVSKDELKADLEKLADSIQRLSKKMEKKSR